MTDITEHLAEISTMLNDQGLRTAARNVQAAIVEIASLRTRTKVVAQSHETVSPWDALELAKTLITYENDPRKETTRRVLEAIECALSAR